MWRLFSISGYILVDSPYTFYLEFCAQIVHKNFFFSWMMSLGSQVNQQTGSLVYLFLLLFSLCWFFSVCSWFFAVGLLLFGVPLP